MKHFFSSSPVQITPFPEYPELHAQVKLPGMFVHVAVPTAQLLDPVVHSSMSENRKEPCIGYRCQYENLKHLTNLSNNCHPG